MLHRAGAGFALAHEPLLEAFISNLSDHDDVLSVEAMRVVGDRLRTRYAQWQPPTTFNWYRAAVLSQATAIALYDALARNGGDAFDRQLRVVEARLEFS